MPVPAHHRRAVATRAVRKSGPLTIKFIVLASVMAASAVVAPDARAQKNTVFHAGTQPDALRPAVDARAERGSAVARGAGAAHGAGAELNPTSTVPPVSPSNSVVASSAPAAPPVPPVVQIPTDTASAVAEAALPAPPSGATAAVAYALRQVGKPYRFGAAGESAFDCSGLVKRAWEEGGISLPHSSYAMAGVGRRISRDDLQPGDLVILYNLGHVQLYIGDDKIVEAPKPGTSVRVKALPSRVDALVRVGE